MDLEFTSIQPMFLKVISPELPIFYSLKESIDRHNTIIINHPKTQMHIPRIIENESFTLENKSSAFLMENSVNIVNFKQEINIISILIKQSNFFILWVF